MKKLHLWMMGAMLAAVLGLVYAAGPGAAGDSAEVVATVKKIAAAIKKGDKEGARKMAETYAKKADSVEEVMDLFKRKDKGGLGFGAPPKEKDGIELRIRDSARDVPSDFAKNAAKYEEMGYHTAAIGLIGEIMTPKKDKGKSTVKGWKTANADMQEAALALAKAKGAANVKSAATKLNNACIACHGEWRN
jgi:hypothetical protein